MRFSVWPTTRQSPEDLIEFARYAESTGWDGIWVADHFMPPAPPMDVPTHECWAILAALAVTVPRVRLGSLVAGNTYRHPAVLANIAATVDHLSGGRLVLGIGTGWQVNEHQAYGIALPAVAERLARLEEACEVLTGLLRRPTTTFDGRFYRLVDASLDPKPLQATLPLLIGGGGEKVTLRIAAQWADEWNTWGSPEVLAHKNAVLDRHCAAVGRDPAAIVRSAQVIVRPDGPGVPAVQLPAGPASITGTASQLRDQMAAYVEAGVDEFILPDWNAGRGAPRRDFFAWFASEVAADFR
jgi:F420-dependent oxidoreductase-like protein